MRRVRASLVFMCQKHQWMMIVRPLTADAVKVGQAVYVTTLRSLGTVLSINGNRVNVDING